MREERKALGITLDDLGIGDLLSSVQQGGGSETNQDEGESITASILKISQVKPNPFQPRKFFSATELENLANSIRSQGLLQPIVVRESEEGDYELIAGERRLRACQIVGLETIPAVIKDISDKACLVLAIIENIQREELNVIELAESLQSMAQKYEMTHAEVGQLIGKSRAAVSNTIRLIQLAEPVKRFLIQGRLDMGHARSLLSAPLELQETLAEKIIEQSLSVRQAEELVRRTLSENAQDASQEPSARGCPMLDEVRKRMGTYFGLNVTLKKNSGQKGGWIGVQYQGDKELESILAKLGEGT